MSQITTTAQTNLSVDTQHLEKSTLERLSKLSVIDWKGRYTKIPTTVTTSEKMCLSYLGKKLKSEVKPVTFPECCTAISKLLTHFWDSQIQGDTLATIQADWYRVLKDHELRTIDAICLEWLSKATRKPTPADILALCNDRDQRPQKIERYRIMYALPVKDPVIDATPEPEGKMLGCPIVLARIMRYAQTDGIPFMESEQMQYLSTGILPHWFRYANKTEIDPNAHLPSRDELLAQMSPEARIIALSKKD